MNRSLKPLSRAIASALLAGEWSFQPMRQRVCVLLAYKWKRAAWLRHLVEGALTRFPQPPHDARDALARWILESELLVAPLSEGRLHRTLRHPQIDAPQMASARWPVQRLDTVADVAHWLELDFPTLDWLADRRGLEHHTREPRLQNYVYHWVPKRLGGVRLLEAPKSRLKAVQRRILADVLDALPAHDAAHGFRPGRSVLTHARLHVGQAVVMRFDLRNFFADVHLPRVYGVFRATGYPEEVARTLIGLCSNRVPMSELARLRPTRAEDVGPCFHLRQRLAAPHLPQGAPTSPALANLCAFALDVRLTALASSLGLTYSRYADDLVFSGDATFRAALDRVARAVGEIAADEGFSLNPEKSRSMPRSRAQEVTGLLVNERLNVRRADYDRLKATLHRCRTRGLEAALAPGETKEALLARLSGEVSWVESVHPARGAKLRASLAAIDR